MKKSWHMRTWDLRHTTIPAHRRHRDWRQCEIKNIVGWKRFTFLTHKMNYSGYSFLYKILGKINGAHRDNALLDMSCIPVSFVNPDTTYLFLFLHLMKFSIWRVSLGNFISEKLVSFSMHCVGTYSARAHSEHSSIFPTSDFSDVTTHSLPREVAAAAGYHFLELLHLRCVADVVHLVVVQSVVDIWRCTRCSDQRNWAYFYATSVPVL